MSINADRLDVDDEFRLDWWRPEVAVFFTIALVHNLDRTIMSGLLQPIKQEFALSDMSTGALSGVAFGIAYATLSLPLARVADLGNRRILLTLSLAAWSVLTIGCGLAIGFWTFLSARLAVGIFEAAAAPALNSLCADSFPIERRTSAASVSTIGWWFGAVIGVSSGGYIADRFGWRAAFQIAGIPGLLLAPMAYRYLKETRPSKPLRGTEILGLAACRTYGSLLAKRGFRYLLVGVMALALWYWGTASWFITFMVRSHHRSLSEASFEYGTLSGMSSLVGIISNAWLGDRLVQRDVRWLGWLPSLGAMGCLIFCTPVFLVANGTLALTCYLIASAFGGVAVPALLAATYAVAGKASCASGVAAFYFCFYLVGLGFGAAAVGALSDRFALHHAQESLRLALLTVTAVLPLSVWFFWRSANSMPHDVANR